MSVARSAAEVLRDHVVLEVEAIDRMYLNVYVPHLQSVGAVVGYLRVHRGQRFASTTAVTPMTEAFVRNIDRFVNDEGVDLVAFFADPHSPWSLPFAPPAPQRIAPPCSPASQLLRQSSTSHVRASSASAPRLPDAGQGVTLPLVKRGTSQLPMHSFCA